MSYENIRNSIVISYADGYLTDEEFLLLYDEFKSTNPMYPYWEYDPFILDNFANSECESHFRISKEDIPTLYEHLQVPDRFICYQGTVCNGIEGLCMLLKRLAFPCRYFDLIQTFARPLPEICMITNTVLDWIYDNHGFRLTSWNQPFLSRRSLEVYSQAIARKGTPLRNCFGFVDGTVRPICRPEQNQRIVYNGHKRVHALKYQAVAVPNGLIANLYGPIEGCRHDAGMLRESYLLDDLQRFAFDTRGNVLCIYGDPAYPMRPNLMCPYRVGEVPVITPAMRDFNKAMSAVRVSVELLFGEVCNYFKFIDFKKNQKIQLSAVGKQYLVCALFTNILTCFYGNKVSKDFQLDPPTVQSYLS